MNKRLALQQLTGFNELFRGGTIISLIESMGLTKKEWLQIRDDEVNWLHRTLFEEIEEYFENML